MQGKKQIWISRSWGRVIAKTKMFKKRDGGMDGGMELVILRADNVMICQNTAILSNYYNRSQGVLLLLLLHLLLL